MHALGALHNKGVITDEAHDAGIVRMIQWGYYFVPINDRTLDNALRADHFSLGPHFRSVADTLSDRASDTAPVINVVALFFKRLKLRSVGTMQASSVVTYVLNALSRRGSWNETERLLRSRLSGVMTLLPIQLDELVQEIDAWKRSRSIALR